MTKEEKLEGLIRHVEKIGLRYTTPKNGGHLCHLFVLPYKIAVHIGGEQDQEFRKKYKKRVFIRDEESLELIISKFDDFCQALQYHHDHYAEYVEAKRKKMQYHEECWQRHLDKLAKREENKKRMAEIKAKKEAQKPKRKRQRIVRYEKVI